MHGAIVNLSPLPLQKFFDNDGIPLAGGKLFTYLAGTTTKTATYTDSSGGTANTNPVILNFRGEANVWLDPTLSYKFVLSPPTATDPPTNPIWTVDNITAAPATIENSAVDTGSGNSIQLSIPALNSTPVIFTRIVWKSAIQNTGNVTISINGGLAKNLLWQNIAALSPGALQVGGMYEALYDGTQWQLQGPTLEPTQMITVEEFLEGVTPTNYLFFPSPRIDVRRYLTAWDDNSVQTSGLQTAVNLALAQCGRLILPNGLNIKTGAIDVEMAGTPGTQGLWIEGQGSGSTQITASGAPTSVFTFRNADSGATSPNEAQLCLEGFTLSGTTASNGIRLAGIANFCLRDVDSSGFLRGFFLESTLLGRIEGCRSLLSTNGLVTARAAGTGVGCNVISVRDSRFLACSSWGAEIGSGSNIIFDTCDFEANGSTGDANTGALRVLATVDDEFGVCMFRLHNSWFEGNKGTPMLVANTSGLKLGIEGCNFINANVSEGGAELTALGLSSVSMADSFFGTGAAGTVDLSGSSARIYNCTIFTLVDTGMVRVFYDQVARSAGTYAHGRTDSFTGTLTGCTTSPTAPVGVIEYGDRIELLMPTLTGTSNTANCTITGMPARFRPSVARSVMLLSIDNGLTLATTPAVVGTDGVITLRPAGTFTGSGTKGSAACTGVYRT